MLKLELQLWFPFPLLVFPARAVWVFAICPRWRAFCGFVAQTRDVFVSNIDARRTIEGS